MTGERILTNARLVLDDEVIRGTVALRNGHIHAIDSGTAAHNGAEDMDGDYLVPGLVELHTDNVESHAFPRPGVRWPMMPALLGHDAAVASAGITTVFDALAIGHDVGKAYRQGLGEDVMRALDSAAEADHLRSDHLLHLRCEISVPDMTEQFDRSRDHDRVRLVSIMDHTPGQRQFVDLDAYRRYYQGKYGVEADEMERQISERMEMQARHAAPQRAHVVDWCRRAGIMMASHDDATEAHVAEAAADGIAIAEFPTTVAAAREARRRGLTTVMGAPNLVRGGSHSGNVSAAALADAGLLDALSSDYIPSSLLQSAWQLGHAGWSLSEAIAPVTRQPACMAGLTDRGRIALALRADLVRVRDTGEGPIVRRVWREGRIVA